MSMAAPSSPQKDSRSPANESPHKSGLQQRMHLMLPSPIVTKRTRTKSTSEIALKNPEVKGTIASFCRTKGHGFITPAEGGDNIFLHISDIDGEYIPLEGDEVTYKLCPIPPKREKCQATHVRIINFTPEVHHLWDSPCSEDAEH